MKNYIIIICISLPFLVIGQSMNISPDGLKNHFMVEQQSKTKVYNLQKAKNELDFTANFLFLFYKEFISSQDDVSCSFEPSCSVYAIQAMQNKGAFEGVLMAFDRLTRCNGLSPENYEILNNGLLNDPVR